MNSLYILNIKTGKIELPCASLLEVVVGLSSIHLLLGYSLEMSIWSCCDAFLLDLSKWADGGIDSSCVSFSLGQEK